MKMPKSPVWWLVLTFIAGPALGLFENRSLSRHAEAANRKESSDDDFSTKVETPLIGQYTNVGGLNSITLHGVGLVVGLDGTGGDPPPSVYRTTLLDDMRKRGVREPNTILQSPTTALVVVRASLPPLIRKGETFDIEVQLPENSGATSLSGGYLMESYLSEQAIVPGRGVLKGHEFAKAKGHILISASGGEADSPSRLLLRGRILGGGVSLKDRDLALFLRNDYRSVRNTKRIGDRIGQRFHHYDRHGLKQPLAEAKDDQKIELKLHPRYKDNFPRYLQVIRNIAFREAPVARRVRMQHLQDELHTPATSARAALQLEAIGTESIPILKSGLRNPDFEVRFHSAVALAYLESSDGIPVLTQAAREEPAFRVFALAALSVLHEADSHIALRELMSEESAETRYGAFRALTTLDANDPFVRGRLMNDQFMLHILDTSGPPMIHMTNRKKSEIVLFGADQRFHPPFVARAGKHILVTSSPGSDTVTVSRFEVGKPDQRKTVSTRVAEVIDAIAEFGGSYPQIAELLVQAEHQHNLPGTIGIDALPQAGRIYVRSNGETDPANSSRTRVGSSHLTPNLYEGAGSDQSSGDDELDSAETLENLLEAEGRPTQTSPKKNSDAAKSEKKFSLFPFRK